MSIDDWIDQTIAAKGYIQAQEHREGTTATLTPLGRRLLGVDSW